MLPTFSYIFFSSVGKMVAHHAHFSLSLVHLIEIIIELLVSFR
jgi:hypothetical protein